MEKHIEPLKEVCLFIHRPILGLWHCIQYVAKYLVYGDLLLVIHK